VKPWLFYSIVRLALFAATVALLVFLGVEGWLAAILGAVIALCLSYIFFARERNKVALAIHEFRERDKDTVGRDEEAEDSEIAERP
jgi:type IV secretory pathway TrbD component